jgi:hypothetical protein
MTLLMNLSGSGKPMPFGGTIGPTGRAPPQT